MGPRGFLPARGRSPARDGAAVRRHHGRDRRLREGRRRGRRPVLDAGPARRGGRGSTPARRRVARRPSRSAHRRLRALRAGTAVLPPPREGIARPGAGAVRGGRGRRRRVRSGAGRSRGRALHALSLPDRSAGARDRRELRAPGDRGRRGAGRAPDLARIRTGEDGSDRRGIRAGTARHGARPVQRLRTLLRRHLAGAGRAPGRGRWRSSSEPSSSIRCTASPGSPSAGRTWISGTARRRSGASKKPSRSRGRRARAPRRAWPVTWARPCGASASSIARGPGASRGSRRGALGLHVPRHLSRRRALRPRPHGPRAGRRGPPRTPRSRRPSRTCAGARAVSAEDTCSCRLWPGSRVPGRARRPSKRRAPSGAIGPGTTSRSCGCASTARRSSSSRARPRRSGGIPKRPSCWRRRAAPDLREARGPS